MRRAASALLLPVTLASLALALPAEPVAVPSRDLLLVLSPRKHERDDILKHYHGKTVRLTGKASVFGGQVEVMPAEHDPKEKFLALRVQFGAEQEYERVRKLIEQNAAKKRPSVLTFVGVAEFVRTFERPTPDYVVPLELRPRVDPLRPMSGYEMWRHALIMANLHNDPLVIEDARKKGKLVTVQEAFPYLLKAARVEATTPKAKPAPKPDPEKVAAARLALAKQLLGEERTRAAAVERLKALIADYPDTAAAEEARELLRR